MRAFRLSGAQRRFLIWAVVASAAMFAAADWSTRTFKVAIDPQAEPCLPWTTFLVWMGREPSAGGLVAFEAQGLAPVFPDGLLLVKRATAGPGDRIEVSAGVVRVNGTQVAELNSEIVAALRRELGSFDRDQVLGDDEYFVLADLPTSSDSRYWGPIRASQIAGASWGMW